MKTKPHLLPSFLFSSSLPFLLLPSTSFQLCQLSSSSNSFTFLPFSFFLPSPFLPFLSTFVSGGGFPLLPPSHFITSAVAAVENCLLFSLSHQSWVNCAERTAKGPGFICISQCIHPLREKTQDRRRRRRKRRRRQWLSKKKVGKGKEIRSEETRRKSWGDDVSDPPSLYLPPSSLPLLPFPKCTSKPGPLRRRLSCFAVSLSGELRPFVARKTKRKGFFFSLPFISRSQASTHPSICHAEASI